MKIHKAAKLAAKTGAAMRRKSWRRGHMILPTNSNASCLIWGCREEDGKPEKIWPMWHPDLEDLTATDWHICTNLEFQKEAPLKLIP